MSGDPAVLEIGLVGCGRWGRNVLRDLVKLGCRVHVVDPAEEAQRVARSLGATGVFEAVSDLPTVRGIVIATSTSSHAAAIDGASPLGVPLFCEKPLANDGATAQRLADSLPERLFVMEKWRYHPAVIEMRSIVQARELGRLVGLRTRRLQWGNPCPDMDCLSLLAPHDLSIARELLGALPRPQHAVATRQAGQVTSLSALLRGSAWMTLEVSVVHSESVREMTAFCEGGSVTLSDDDYGALRILRTEDTRASSEPAIRWVSTESPLTRELERFLRFLDGGPAPLSSAAEGAESVAVLDRLRELSAIEQDVE